jgi:serine/threonine protein phosphatase 1
MNIDNEVSTAVRIIAIGDIHGRADALSNIMKDINPTSDDVLIFLGDVINRGSDSKGVVDQILDLNKITKTYSILGNHEEMLLGAFQGGKSDDAYFLKFGGKETLQSYGVSNVKDLPPEHLLYFSRCKDYLETKDFIFVHAGCKSDIPLEKNFGEILRWIRLYDQDVYTKPHASGKIVVCGHTVQQEVLDLGHLLCIDTGCGVLSNGRLSAIDLKSRFVWQS